MDMQSIVARLHERFGEAIGEVEQPEMEPIIVVHVSKLVDIAAFLRDDPELACDSLMCLTGLDLPPEQKKHAGKKGEEKPEEPEGPPAPYLLGVVYHLFSFRHRHRVALKVLVPREDPRVPTVTHLWPAANWHEREAFDLFGIIFDGHPDLRRILLPDDWEGYPLRKDYVVQEHYEIEGTQVRVPRGW